MIRYTVTVRYCGPYGTEWRTHSVATNGDYADPAPVIARTRDELDRLTQAHPGMTFMARIDPGGHDIHPTNMEES